MTTDVGRPRGGGERRRGRPRTPDALPQPRSVKHEVDEARVRLSAFTVVYTIEHEALLALGSSEVHVTSSPGSVTEATVIDRENEAARRRCARAVAHLRSASTHVEMALKAFGPLVEQPGERSPDAVVDQSTFERAVNRREHQRREEELRHG
jgi:hypothetical protein